MKPYTGIMLGLTVVSLIPTLLFLKGEGGWLYSFSRAKVKNKKQYAKFLGKIMALIAASFLVSGLISFILPAGAAAVFLIAGCAYAVIYAKNRINEHY